jgi:hypothetical protein
MEGVDLFRNIRCFGSRKCLMHMSISAHEFKNHNYFDFKKIEINYAHTYDYFEGTVEILDKNMLYFELYKKINF